MKVKIEYHDLPPLEEYCDCVEGKRWCDEQDNLIPCTDCIDGYKPTEFGIAILKFIRQYESLKI